MPAARTASSAGVGMTAVSDPAAGAGVHSPRDERRPGGQPGVDGCRPARWLATVGWVTGGGVVIGVVTRTGSAVLVALSGSADAPRFAARREIGLVPATLPAQPYHAAAGLELPVAEEMIADVEQAAEDAAMAGLDAMASGLPDSSAIAGVAVMVKAISLPGSLAEVMRSHAWLHAAEGVLYREAVLAAARRCGWPAHAAEMSALPAAELRLAAIGLAAGRPWRRIEKDAARTAIIMLQAAPGRP